MQLVFKLPAKFNDILSVKNTLLSAKGASLVFQQKVFREDELLCEAEVKVACLYAKRFKPMLIPSFMLTELLGEH